MGRWYLFKRLAGLVGLMAGLVGILMRAVGGLRRVAQIAGTGEAGRVFGYGTQRQA